MLRISKRDFAPLALTLLGAVALVLLMVSTAFADGPRPMRGDVMNATPDTYNANWVIGVSADGGAKGESIILGDDSDDATDFAYYSFREWWDQNLSDVTKIRASFMPAAGTVNSGGSPRISLEVDLNGNGSVLDDYTVIYLDPAHCGDLLASGWTQSDFTGDLTNCSIYTSLSATPYTSDGVISAWDMLVADPTFADAKVWFAYLIQDASVGANYVDRIMLDSAFLTKQP
jgi:hypothetical protein